MTGDDAAIAGGPKPTNRLQPGENLSLKDSHGVPIVHTDFLFPADDRSLDKPRLSSTIMAELPTKEEASRLIDLYYQRSSWEVTPVLRERLVQDFYVPCYEIQGTSINYQKLALLYIVFAMAILQSLELPSSGRMARKYVMLSRACLSIDDPLINSSPTVVDILLLHVAYDFTSDEPFGYLKADAVLGLTLKIAYSIGLHRDPSLWNLSPKEVINRRRTMWELISLDLWTSLLSGRPPLTNRRYIDCKLPIDPSDLSDSEPNFTRGKHFLSAVCLWRVIDLAHAPINKATYSAVCKLDTNIRQWTLPKAMLASISAVEDETTAAHFKRATMAVSREVMLLCLHKAYFASALLEPPFDPMKSQYSRSLMAAFASACAIVSHIRPLFSQEPIMVMTVSFLWTQCFTAAVILGALVVRAPECSLSPTALFEFDHTLEMFKRAQGRDVARGLPILLRLNERAHNAMNAFKSGTWVPPTETDTQLFRGLAASGVVHQPAQNNPTPLANTQDHRPQTAAPPPDIAPAPLQLSQNALDSLGEFFRRRDPPSYTDAAYPYPTSDQFLREMIPEAFVPTAMAPDPLFEMQQGNATTHSTPPSFAPFPADMFAQLNGLQQKAPEMRASPEDFMLRLGGDTAYGSAPGLGDPTFSFMQHDPSVVDPRSSILWDSFWNEFGTGS
ncbi:hypothetical protein FRC17_002828 [Serendipita sp. 399]|nr:hypothetical protein FRC17_002828 [Serendipita sp. 399]